MWLRTLHVFGLTNLTDEQIAAFEAIVSLRRARSSEGDMLNSSVQHERYASPSPLTFLSSPWRFLSARGLGEIAVAYLQMGCFLVIIISINKFNLIDKQEFVGMTVYVILLAGLSVSVLSIALGVLGRVIIHLYRKHHAIYHSESHGPDGSLPQISGPE